jgi:hypothetical protein
LDDSTKPDAPVTFRDVLMKAGYNLAREKDVERLVELLRRGQERQDAEDTWRQRRSQIVVWAAGAIGTTGIALGLPELLAWLTKRFPP